MKRDYIVDHHPGQTMLSPSLVVSVQTQGNRGEVGDSGALNAEDVHVGWEDDDGNRDENTGEGRDIIEDVGWRL